MSDGAMRQGHEVLAKTLADNEEFWDVFGCGVTGRASGRQCSSAHGNSDKQVPLVRSSSCFITPLMLFQLSVVISFSPQEVKSPKPRLPQIMTLYAAGRVLHTIALPSSGPFTGKSGARSKSGSSAKFIAKQNRGHVAARSDLQVIWAMEGMLKRMVKRALLSSRTSRNDIAAGVEFRRYLKPEDAFT
jgi:hypothetical protein